MTSSQLGIDFESTSLHDTSQVRVSSFKTIVWLGSILDFVNQNSVIRKFDCIS